MTIGQAAYERHNRRNPEAPAWDTLPACLQHTWDRTAEAVKAEVRRDENEMLAAYRNEHDRLSAELGSAREVLRNVHAALIAGDRAFALGVIEHAGFGALS